MRPTVAFAVDASYNYGRRGSPWTLRYRRVQRWTAETAGPDFLRQMLRPRVRLEARDEPFLSRDLGRPGRRRTLSTMM